MSEAELLLMSQRERDRLKVLHEVARGHLTQRQAAGQLGLTDRWVRKLLGRLRKAGDGGVVHRLRGRASKRKIPAARRERILVRGGRRYADFGPQLAAEKLAQEGLGVSRETRRKGMSAA